MKTKPKPVIYEPSADTWTDDNRHETHADILVALARKGWVRAWRRERDATASFRKWIYPGTGNQ